MTTILPLYHSEDFAILTTSTDRLVFPYAGITQVRFKGCVLSPPNRLIGESTPNNLYFLSAAMLHYSCAKVKKKINEVEISVCPYLVLYPQACFPTTSVFCSIPLPPFLSF